MKTLIAIAVLLASAPSLFTLETAPPLSLAKAAQISEGVIEEANLPPDCFLRSIQLKMNTAGTLYYRVLYKPVPAPPVEDKGEEAPKIDVIHVSMGGEAVFLKEDAPVARRRRVIVGEAPTMN